MAAIRTTPMAILMAYGFGYPYGYGYPFGARGSDSAIMAALAGYGAAGFGSAAKRTVEAACRQAKGARLGIVPPNRRFPAFVLLFQKRE